MQKCKKNGFSIFSRLNVKFQRHFCGEKYKYFCSQNGFQAMHIVGEYGSRWSCRSRNSVAIFDDLTSTKSSLKDFCTQFKKENPRLKAIAEHMNNYGTQTLAELGIFSLIWQCLLKPFWTTLSKPRAYRRIRSCLKKLQ